jgi:TolA-binding protein
VKDKAFDTVVAALREESSKGTLDAARVRRRVLASLAKKRGRPLRRIGLLPMVAVLVGSLAMAATSASRRAKLVHAFTWWNTAASPRTAKVVAPVAPRSPVQEELASLRQGPAKGEVALTGLAPSLPAAVAAAVSSNGETRVHRPAAVAIAADTLRSETRSPARAETAAPAATPSGLASIAEASAAATTPATASTPLDPEELALARAAHDLHFKESDPARAAQAWESYLRAFPSGTFAIEARFNLALCWLKTGRRVEAERVLEQFADGSLGPYRRTEASTLLRLLRDEDSGD